MFAQTDVNVRTGPGTTYRAIGALARGNPASVVDSKRGWYRIQYGRGYGWVHGRYLRSAIIHVPPSQPAIQVPPSETVVTKVSAPASPPASTPAATLPTAPMTVAGDALASSDPEAAAPAEVVPASQVATASDERGAAAHEETRVAAARLSGPVEVSGIALHWGMSPSAAKVRYADRAERIEANGAVWLEASSAGAGVKVPVEWFDLRFCNGKLCAIHHVFNDVEGQRKIGDSLVAAFTKKYGKPKADFWSDFGYGRVRVRTWREGSTRIRLSHQEAQTYVAVDYEPLGAAASPKTRPSPGPIALE
jgi:hypothetical protein